MEYEEDMQIDARSLSSPTLKIKQKKEGIILHKHTYTMEHLDGERRK